ncbi:dihydropteroate synthase [Cytophagales bacterium RKSG123]|nr:dihydropteroate synthase [Xanthovirga aplysinae]
MGILNVTPDSFFERSRYCTEKEILAQAERILNEGASLIDIGGYSSRPNAEDISPEEEIKRVIPAIEVILKHFPDAKISVDTFRASVARKTIEAGASMINDISGGNLDSQMFQTVSELKVPYVMMHMRGTPATMQSLTSYDNLLLELLDYFQKKIFELRKLGVNDIIIDPGFGFAKTLAQNYEILKKLDYFEVLEAPLLVGISRKSMIYKELEISPEESLNGTTVLNTLALSKGAAILRVHDVKQAVEAVKLFKLTVH